MFYDAFILEVQKEDAYKSKIDGLKDMLEQANRKASFHSMEVADLRRKVEKLKKQLNKTKQAVDNEESRSVGSPYKPKLEPLAPDADIDDLLRQFDDSKPQVPQIAPSRVLQEKSDFNFKKRKLNQFTSENDWLAKPSKQLFPSTHCSLKSNNEIAADYELKPGLEMGRKMPSEPGAPHQAGSHQGQGQTGQVSQISQAG